MLIRRHTEMGSATRRILIAIAPACLLALMLVTRPLAATAQSDNGVEPSLSAAAVQSLGSGTPIDGQIDGPWLEFAFTGGGTLATGCAPADPAGPGCTSSSGGNSVFVGAPPWTFTAPGGGLDLTVTDAFLNGDEFEIFDFGASIGLTAVAGSGSCGSDPVPCLANPASSSGVRTG